ncbi:MAG: hypothetical protein PVSMB1_14010 [Gemmatimonadaceae bacterium]
MVELLAQGGEMFCLRFGVGILLPQVVHDLRPLARVVTQPGIVIDADVTV